MKTLNQITDAQCLALANLILPTNKWVVGSRTEMLVFCKSGEHDKLYINLEKVKDINYFAFLYNGTEGKQIDKKTVSQWLAKNDFCLLNESELAYAEKVLFNMKDDNGELIAPSKIMAIYDWGVSGRLIGIGTYSWDSHERCFDFNSYGLESLDSNFQSEWLQKAIHVPLTVTLLKEFYNKGDIGYEYHTLEKDLKNEDKKRN